MKESFDLFKKSILKVMENNFPNRNVGAYEIFLHPDTKNEFISFTFFLSEESELDLFIREVRSTLLKWPVLNIQSETNKFTYEVWKTHIQSHDYWNVNFWLADEYLFQEDSQP